MPGTSPGMTVNDCAATNLSGCVPHLQHTPANLILLDRLEQRLEVAFAKTIVALALDEFEENRPDRVRRKDLQQHLGVAAVDHALTMLRQARVDLLEIGIRRGRHERQARIAQGLDGAVDVPRATGDVLNTLA